MSNIFFIAAIVFLYIAYGATWKLTHPRDFALPATAMILNNIICIIGYIIPTICIYNLTNIAWYWSAFINFIAIISISHIIASFYTAIFGCKTEEMLDYETGIIHRNSLHGIDAIITVCIGIIFFIIAIFI
jgi:hypothetical protein